MTPSERTRLEEIEHRISTARRVGTGPGYDGSVLDDLTDLLALARRQEFEIGRLRAALLTIEKYDGGPATDIARAALRGEEGK